MPFVSTKVFLSCYIIIKTRVYCLYTVIFSSRTKAIIKFQSPFFLLAIQNCFIIYHLFETDEAEYENRSYLVLYNLFSAPVIFYMPFPSVDVLQAIILLCDGGGDLNKC